MALATITWYLDATTVADSQYSPMIKSITFGLSLWRKGASFKLIDRVQDKSDVLHVTIYMREFTDVEYPSIAISEPVSFNRANIALDKQTPWNMDTVHWWNRFFGNGLDLSRTITHEIGHCVGLRHTTVVSSIMVQQETALPSKPSPQDITNFASRVAALAADASLRTRQQRFSTRTNR